MNLEFLSGLALVTVTLAVVIYVIKELIGDRVGDLKKGNRKLAKAFRKYVSREAAPVNSHLIGSIGTVIAHSGDGDRPMRVRLGLELWPARMRAEANSLVAVGTSVEVTEVDGPVLVVVASGDVAELLD
jgi:membrane protein implicated in regulation of membrane protease activity